MAEGAGVTLKDLARCADVFYVGGTKVGALFGEAVVVTRPELLPHFFPLIKQHGALLAKAGCWAYSSRRSSPTGFTSAWRAMPSSRRSASSRLFAKGL